VGPRYRKQERRPVGQAPGAMSVRKLLRHGIRRCPAATKTGRLVWRSNSTATDRGRYQNHHQTASPTVAKTISEKILHLATHLTRSKQITI